MASFGVSVPWKEAKTIKDFLESQKLLAKSLKTTKSDDRSRVIFPLNFALNRDQIDDVMKKAPTRNVQIDEFVFSVNKNRTDETTGESVVQKRALAALKEIARKEKESRFPVVAKEAEEEKDRLTKDSTNFGWEERVPKWKWERHDDLLILPQEPCFKFLEDEVGIRCWSSESLVAFLHSLAPGCRRLAVQGAIRDDDFRSPELELVLGESTIVRHRDNGIIYEFDVSKCMFSSGNITEKMRVAKFDCKSETVVDLYAGVGYFTLPYLVHANAEHVIACEWNPDSVIALKKNLELNGVTDRCTVLAGDNRKTCPVGVAHRLNLGLLPSAEASFPVAARALKKPNASDDVRWIHVHANVDRDVGYLYESQTARFSCNKTRIFQSWSDWAEATRSRFEDLLRRREEETDSSDGFRFQWTCESFHCEHVKSFGPKTDHLVLDLLCRPVAIW